MAAIFFDVDGTLVRWDRDYHSIVREALERAVGEADEAWLDRYNDSFFHHFESFAEDPYRRAFADVCGEFGLDADPERLAETLIECEFGAVDPVPGIASVLPALAERHTLGLLTNGVPRVQFGKVERHGFLDYFDVRVASHQGDVQAIKPDPGIYDAARERVDADELVMVGDDREPDVEAARENGFTPVHLDANADEVVAPDFATLATLLADGT